MHWVPPLALTLLLAACATGVEQDVLEAAEGNSLPATRSSSAGEGQGDQATAAIGGQRDDGLAEGALDGPRSRPDGTTPAASGTEGGNPSGAGAAGGATATNGGASCSALSCATAFDCVLANLSNACSYSDCVGGVCVDAPVSVPTFPAADAGAPASSDECQSLFCFDVFDCAIFHLGNQCGFTACVNFVCVQ